jgi:phospholipid N-methyltransferase
MKKTFCMLLISSLVAHGAYCSITDFFRDTLVFTKEIVHNQREVGALFSCSSFTAKELTRYLYNNKAQDDGTYYVLEVGAGTGAVTEVISKLLDDPNNQNIKYVFDVVEINETMCKHLRLKFYDRPQVRIHCCSILDWKPEYTYNYIISTLPHNSLETQLVKGVAHQYQQLAQQNCILSYIEYIGGATATKLFLPKRKAEVIEIQNTLHQLRKKHHFKTNKVLLNLFPAYVHHLQFKS